MIRNTPNPFAVIKQEHNFDESSISAPTSPCHPSIIDSNRTFKAAPKREQDLPDIMPGSQSVDIKHESVLGKKRILQDSIPPIPVTPPMPTGRDNKRARISLPEQSASDTNLSASPDVVRNRPQPINQIIGAGASVGTVKNLPIPVTQVFIITGASVVVAAGKNIPAHIKLISSVEAVRNTPTYITEIGIGPGASVAAVKNLPAQIRTVKIYKGASVEVVRNIPTHVIQLNITIGTSVEAVKNLPLHVTQVLITTGAGEAVKNIPKHITEIIIGEASVEAVKNLPTHINKVTISAGTSVEVVRNIPAHVRKAAINSSVSVDIIRNIPASVLTIYLPRNLFMLIPPLPVSVKTIHFI